MTGLAALGPVLWVVLGLLAGVMTVVLVARPRLALLLLVVVESSNASGVLGARFGLSVYLASLALATVCLVLAVVRGRLRLYLPRVVLLAAFFTLAQAPSVLAAQDVLVSWTDYVDLLKNLWFLTLVVLLAGAVSGSETDPLRGAWTIARGLAGTMAAIATLGLVNQFLLGGSQSFAGFSVVSTSLGVGVATGRHAGPFDDPNFYGRVLLLAIPLSVALVIEARGRGQRRAAQGWMFSTAALAGGVYLTGSRGALLGLLVVVVVGLVAAGPTGRRRLVLVPLAAVVLLAVPGVGSRLTSLTEVQEASSGLGDASLVERTSAQQVSLAVFAAHPMLGVGPANIPTVWREFADRTDVPVRRVVAPHNLYLQLAAERGSLGLIGWLVFYGGVLLLALRVVLITPLGRGERAPPERVLASAAIAALCGWAAASVFLHLSFLRPLLLVVALVGVLDRQVRPAPLGQALPPLRRRSRVLTVAVASVLVLAATVAVERFTRPPEYVATALVTISPPKTAASSAYAYDLLTRSAWMPTFAGVIDTVGRESLARADTDTAEIVRMDVVGNSTRAVVTVEVRGRNRDGALELADAVARSGAAYINDESGLSALGTADVESTSVVRLPRW